MRVAVICNTIILLIAQKLKFSIKDFFRTDLVTFTEEILNEKLLHFWVISSIEICGYLSNLEKGAIAETPRLLRCQKDEDKDGKTFLCK